MGHQKMKAVHVNGQDVAVRLGRQRTTSTTVVMGRYTENTEPLSDILKKNRCRQATTVWSHI